ncbi:MAG: transglutaminase-like domain-containing protein [Acidobacteriota bacterium]
MIDGHWRSVIRLALAAGLTMVSAASATVESRTVRVEIAPDRVVEHETLVVRIDDGDDLDQWSIYAVALDDHRELLDFDAAVITAEGRRRTIRRRDRDRMQASDAMILHTSQSFEVIEPEGLSLGARLEISHSVATRPWFTAGQIGLDLGDTIERFAIEVHATPAVTGFRHRLQVPTNDGIEVTETPNSLRITGSWSPTSPPSLAVSEHGLAVLRFAWGAEATWPSLGRWYADLLRTVPREPTTMARRLAELDADEGTPSQRLDRLVRFLRHKVRYVAVEVGIGGYVPSAPAEVAERRWGDCKDKGLLLIELLRAAGIRAHPVLIRLDDTGGIDPDFPTPLAFNHLIVAVDASTLGEPEDAESSWPIADGFVFIDATQTLGGVDFLHEGVQGQHALVVIEEEPGESRLVRTPWRPQTDRIVLDVDLLVESSGDARGNVRLRLDGDAAAGLVTRSAETAPMEMESLARRILAHRLPGATIDTPTWSAEDGELPRFEMAAPMTIQLGDRHRFDSPPLLPASRMIDELAEEPSPPPATVDAGISSTRIQLRLPDEPGVACPPKTRDDVIENPLGRVQHTVSVDADGAALVIERRAELSRGRIEVEELGALRDLAVAEHRARRRSLRWRCR